MVLHSKAFNVTMGVVILINTVTIGVEQSMRLQGSDTTIFAWLEHLFLVIYIAELSLRFFVYGVSCIRDSWVRFDLTLVIIGVLTTYVVANVSDVGYVSVLRTVRPLRLARAVRLFAKFRELWMLVRCLLNSSSTMLYTMFLLTIVLYIFSSVAIELITMDERAQGPGFDPEFQLLVEEYFSTLPMAMLTLLQFVCMDDLNEIYKPLIQLDWTLSIFFIATILIVSIVLMNLVTAVVVNGALEQAYQDKEMMKRMQDEKQRKLLKDLREMFMRLDEDESGEISVEELQNVTEEDRALLFNAIACGDPMEVFHALDVDNVGNIAIEDFLEAIYKVSVSKAPIEMKRVEKQVDAIREQLRRLDQQLSFRDGEVRRQDGIVSRGTSPMVTSRRDRGMSGSSYSNPEHGSKVHDSALSEELAVPAERVGDMKLRAVSCDGAPQDALMESIRAVVREELRLAFILRSDPAPAAASASATVVISAAGSAERPAVDALAARALLDEMEALRRQLATTDNFMQTILQHQDSKLSDRTPTSSRAPSSRTGAGEVGIGSVGPGHMGTQGIAELRLPEDALDYVAGGPPDSARPNLFQDQLDVYAGTPVMRWSIRGHS